jgi:hypothetical protein
VTPVVYTAPVVHAARTEALRSFTLNGRLCGAATHGRHAPVLIVTRQGRIPLKY